MRRVFGARIVLACAVISLSLPIGSPIASDAENAEAVQERKLSHPWQGVISEQIVALRQGDAPAAFSLAGGMFQRAYMNPYIFYADIARSGYTPILESYAHSFGAFEQLDEARVLQIVRISTPDQKLHEVLYQLEVEEGAWRIHGVTMKPSTGMHT